jgi:cytochrome c
MRAARPRFRSGHRNVPMARLIRFRWSLAGIASTLHPREEGQAPSSNATRTLKVNAMKLRELKIVLAAAAGVLLLPGAHAFEEEAARELARQNNCFKCHAVAKDKDGPAYKKVAEKYKGKPEAQQRLVTHITSGEKAKFPDGHEEAHKIVKTDPPNDMKQIRNLIDWILAQ